MVNEKSCGVIIVDSGKVLLVKQKKSGYFNFPKGHMDDLETEVETAIREVKEETNLDVKIDESKRFEISYELKNGVLKTVVYFLGVITGGYISALESEISDIIWVEIDKVEDLLSFDNLKVLWCDVCKYL